MTKDKTTFRVMYTTPEGQKKQFTVSKREEAENAVYGMKQSIHSHEYGEPYYLENELAYNVRTRDPLTKQLIGLWKHNQDHQKISQPKLFKKGSTILYMMGFLTKDGDQSRMYKTIEELSAKTGLSQIDISLVIDHLLGGPK